MAFGGGRAPGWKDHARNLQDWFGTWASTTRNIRAVWDGLIPVAVIDRFRDDSEGSVFGISAFTTGLAGEQSAVAMGSSINDVELLSIACRSIFFPSGAVLANDTFHLFTPINPYNPVATPNPVGFFSPGLITNKSFTFGTVTAVAGTNPVLPAIIGFEWHNPWNVNTAAFGALAFGFANGLNVVDFDPPIRVYRDTTLAVQQTFPPGGGSFSMLASFLYRERPRTTP